MPTILVASGPSLLPADLELLKRIRDSNSSPAILMQAAPQQDQMPLKRPADSLQQLQPVAPLNPAPMSEKAAAAVAERTTKPAPRPIVALINDTYKLAPWADLLYAADARWWNHHAPQFNGEKWTTKRDDPTKRTIYKISDSTIRRMGLLNMPGCYADGLSFDPQVIHFGGNSGFQLLNLVILAGAKNIGLLGYDMQPDQNDPEKMHFFGNHPKGFSSPKSCFKRWIENFNIAAGQLRGTDIRVVNLTRRTALDCFPQMTIESFFNVQ